jgi:hypothetical protein
VSRIAFVALGCLTVSSSAAWADAPDIAQKTIASQGAYLTAVSLADEVGARLAGSPAAARAVAWAEREMKARGLSNVHQEAVTVEPWSRGTGDRVELVGAHPRVLHALALGRSPGTPATGLSAEVVEVDSFEALTKLGDKARGKIVFFNKPMPRSKGFDQYGTIGALRFRGAIEASRVGAVAALVRSVGTGWHRLPHTGATGLDPKVPAIPFAALAAEDAELLHRALLKGPAKVAMNLSCGMRGPVQSANVVGEVRGRDKPNEIVLIGAHLDSWDVGDGALDDGAGVGIVLEAARQLQAQGGSSRTVRVVLFMNEECGLSGAKAYAQAHAAEVSRHVAALEADAGGGAPLGFWATGGEQGKTFIGKLARPLAKYGAGEVQSTDETGADLIPLQALGVPTVAVNQDASDYFEWHHTDGDTADKLIEAQVDTAAGVFAAMVQALANAKDAPPRLAPHKPDL